MFDFISQKFSSIFGRLKGATVLSPEKVNETMIQVKDALLEADVPYDVVESFAQEVTHEVLNTKVHAALKPSEHLLKIIHDKIVAFLGGKSDEARFELPSIIMVMGLQGAGKTTAIGKLGSYIRKEAEKKGKSRRILLASVDFYRPAAIDQLEILAGQAGVSFYRAVDTHPVKAAQEIVAYQKKHGYELLLLDTAGRLHVDSMMLNELRDIDIKINPRYKILVLDAMTGQESLNVARAFDQAVGFESAFLTKMDSDTRGGAAFSFRYTLKKPIIFVGTGEKIDDIDRFHVERVASRMLGMGDMQTLIERAQEKIKDSEQDDMMASFKRGDLTLEDFAKQMDMMARLGSLSTVMKMMPGVGNINAQQLEEGQREMKRFRAIINSMTPKERLNAALIENSRKKRIAQGAGVKVEEINTLLQRFQQAQQYVKLLKKAGPLRNLFR